MIHFFSVSTAIDENQDSIFLEESWFYPLLILMWGIKGPLCPWQFFYNETKKLARIAITSLVYFFS